MSEPQHNVGRAFWRLMAVVAVFAVAWLAWLQWKPIRYARDKIHPSLKALREPYREVHATVLLDGGSIPVQIVDADGKTFGCLLGVGGDYRTIHIDPDSDGGHGNAGTTSCEHTKGFLEQLLRQHDDRISVRQALAYWRPRPFDYVMFVWIRVTDPAWERQK